MPRQALSASSRSRCDTDRDDHQRQHVARLDQFPDEHPRLAEQDDRNEPHRGDRDDDRDSSTKRTGGGARRRSRPRTPHRREPRRLRAWGCRATRDPTRRSAPIHRLGAARKLSRGAGIPTAGDDRCRFHRRSSPLPRAEVERDAEHDHTTPAAVSAILRRRNCAAENQSERARRRRRRPPASARAPAPMTVPNTASPASTSRRRPVVMQRAVERDPDVARREQAPMTRDSSTRR